MTVIYIQEPDRQCIAGFKHVIKWFESDDWGFLTNWNELKDEPMINEFDNQGDRVQTVNLSIKLFQKFSKKMLPIDKRTLQIASVHLWFKGLATGDLDVMKLVKPVRSLVVHFVFLFYADEVVKRPCLLIIMIIIYSSLGITPCTRTY